MSTMTDAASIPTGFWKQIDHQLDRIEQECPDTYDEVREILLDPAYADVQADMNRNWVRKFSADQAFFAGSGGERSLRSALRDAGWVVTASMAWYYWAVEHPVTKEALTYIEGDVMRGPIEDHA
jgi:hypothetical protein